MINLEPDKNPFYFSRINKALNMKPSGCTFDPFSPYSLILGIYILILKYVKVKNFS